jgi:citrate synthase
MSSSHFLFIPGVLLIGVIIGWVLGSRAARDAFAVELKRREERAARKTHLRRMSQDLGKRSGNTAWFDMSQRIEALVKGEKKLNPNVDFYSASTYFALGIPIDLYTPVFAVSHMSGWTAHILEQYANNRLIRPRAEYIGPEYPQRLLPMEQR